MDKRYFSISWRFHKNYNEKSDEGYFFEADFQYIEKLHEPHNYLPFLPERKKNRKVEKLVANLHDKSEYVIHIRNLKQPLHHGLVFKKVHRVIKFNQNAWLKTYEHRSKKKKRKIILKKTFLSWWITVVIHEMVQFFEKL